MSDLHKDIGKPKGGRAKSPELKIVDAWISAGDYQWLEDQAEAKGIVSAQMASMLLSAMIRHNRKRGSDIY